MKSTSRPWARACAVLAMVVLPPLHAASLLPPVAGDTVPAVLMDAPLPAPGGERLPLVYAWALDPARALQAPVPHVASSRSYWQQVAARRLQQGIELPLTAPGAVVLVSPAPGALPLPPEALELRDGAGRRSRAGSVPMGALQGAGMPVSSGSCLLRVGPADAPGRYRLRARRARGHYVVQVLEPESPLRLELQASHMQVAAGGRLRVQARLQDDGNAGAGLRHHLAGFTGEALLVAPDGRTWLQPMQPGSDGSLQATVAIPADVVTTPGPWELQVFTQAEGLLRDGKVAFAVVRPTARLSGQARADAGKREVVLPLQVAAAGRYAAHGTLYASTADGVLRPVAQAHAAAWFDEPGQGELRLGFGQVALPPGHGAPYELRALQLHDQSRMAPLESRARALVF